MKQSKAKRSELVRYYAFLFHDRMPCLWIYISCHDENGNFEGGRKDTKSLLQCCLFYAIAIQRVLIPVRARLVCTCLFFFCIKAGGDEDGWMDGWMFTFIFIFTITITTLLGSGFG